MIGIALMLMAAAPSGPAIIFIQTQARGEQFAYFSSFERCEAFRRQLEADWERRTRALLGIKDSAQPTPKPVAGTESRARCIAG